MNHRQQQADVIARMRARLARQLGIANDAPEDWRERRDEWGDDIVKLERLDRRREHGDDPATWGTAA